MLKVLGGKALCWQSGRGAEGLMAGRAPFCIYNVLDKSILFQTLLFNRHVCFHSTSLMLSFLLVQFGILILIQQ